MGACCTTRAAAPEWCEAVPVTPPELDDGRVALAPFEFEVVEGIGSDVDALGLIDRAAPFTTPLRSFQEQKRIAPRMRCTTQVWTTVRGQTAFDRVAQAGEAVTAADENIGHTPVAQFGEDTEPELGALVGLAESQAQDVSETVNIDAQGYVDGPVHDAVTVADFHDDRVDIEDRVDAIQGPRPPGPQLLEHPVGDPGDEPS